MLRLITFGGLSLTGSLRAEQTALQRRQLALLALLASAAERGMSRDKLFAYLWPESDASRARHALNQTVYSLRRSVGVPVISTAGAQLRLNTPVIGADVIDFQTAMHNDRVAEATAFYTGTFLDGFFVDAAPEFEQWAELERARLAKLADLAVESLAQAATTSGDHKGAALLWLRLAERDPLNSRVALATMQALARSGDRASALRHGERHTTLLSEELNAAADTRVLALMSSLRESSDPPPASLGASRPVAAALELQSPRDALRRQYVEHVSHAVAGRYAVRGQADRTGTSMGFHAVALSNGAPVTLRVIQPGLAALLDVRQFLSVLRRVADLRHPNLGRLIDAGESEQVVFYVAEPIEGETLRARLATERQLGLEDALNIAADLAAGLRAAHVAGVWHLDVKPRNVLLRGGHAVLTEVGIAPTIAAAAGEAMTRSGVTLGTPAYMSPEQVAGERQLDGRSDIYSLGCLLFHMLAGEPPFAGPTAQAVLVRRLTESAPTLRSSRGEVPAALERVVARMLARVPADRFRTMEEAHATLREFADRGL
jgi:DNA-binding SARP family transcriptional activator